MRNTFWKYNIYWLLWLCLISYLSNAQSSAIPRISIFNFEGADKVVHFIFYMMLMLSMHIGFAKQNRFPVLIQKSLSYPFMISVLWGSFMELTQLFIFTYRSAELNDLLANTLGAVVGLFISYLANKLIILLKLN